MRIIDAFTEWCGELVSLLTSIMVLITCTIVVMRYGLESGSIALQESLSYLHATVFMLGIAFTLKRGGHVRVDIFYRNYSPKTKALIDLVGTVVLLFPVCLAIFWLSFEYVSSSWAIREVSSESAGLPWIYLLKTLLLIMPILLLLQAISEFSRLVRVLTTPQSHCPEQG